MIVMRVGKGRLRSGKPVDQHRYSCENSLSLGSRAVMQKAPGG